MDTAARASSARGRRRRRESRARRSIVYMVSAQVTFLGLLALCIHMSPAGLASDNGVSYYGAHSRTLLPYCLAFLLSGALVVLSARSLRASGAGSPTLERGLTVFAGLLVPIILTPYSLGTTVNVVHTIAAASLFLEQLWLGLWLVRRADLGLIGLSLWIVQVLLIALVALSLARVTRVMLEGEVAFELVACLLFMRAIPALAASSRPQAATP
ncbi:MAG: hypothetical protein ACXVZP_06800 [Gaiellaceae bacterium]